MKQINIPTDVPTALPILFSVISMFMGAISIFVFWWLSLIGLVFGAISAAFAALVWKEGASDGALVAIAIALAVGLGFNVGSLILLILPLPLL